MSAVLLRPLGDLAQSAGQIEYITAEKASERARFNLSIRGQFSFWVVCFEAATLYTARPTRGQDGTAYESSHAWWSGLRMEVFAFRTNGSRTLSRDRWAAVSRANCVPNYTLTGDEHRMFSLPFMNNSNVTEH